MVAEVFVADARGEGADAVTATFTPCRACTGATLFVDGGGGGGGSSGAAVTMGVQSWPVDAANHPRGHPNNRQRGARDDNAAMKTDEAAAGGGGHQGGGGGLVDAGAAQQPHLAQGVGATPSVSEGAGALAAPAANATSEHDTDPGTRTRHETLLSNAAEHKRVAQKLQQKPTSAVHHRKDHNAQQHDTDAGTLKKVLLDEYAAAKKHPRKVLGPKAR
jgi:hypothetical protein